MNLAEGAVILCENAASAYPSKSLALYQHHHFLFYGLLSYYSAKANSTAGFYISAGSQPNQSREISNFESTA
jgi:hypothetical protein